MADSPSSPRFRRWQGTAPRPVAARAPAAAKRGKIIAVVFAILVLIGAIAAWVLWPDPVRSPYFLALWVNEYRDPRIPVSPWADQDRSAWVSLPWKDNNAFTSQQRNLLIQELRNLEKVKQLDEAVLVYLEAYAITGTDGNVALLPGDASLDDPSTWLPIDDVLKHVRVCPAKHKLLLLDLTQPFADARAGVLNDDVAARLAPALKAATDEDANLRIITSSSPGQVSHASEDLGHSIFAYFLLQGLQGKADSHNAENKQDARVSVLELADYVAFQVDRWAWANRKARQTPQLIGKREDFHLVTVEPRDVRPVQAVPLPGTYPDALRKRWEQRDRWLADQSFRAAPRAFLGLEAAIMRAEQQWRAGIPLEKIEQELAGKIGRLDQDRTQRQEAVIWPDPTSLALHVALKGQKPPDLTSGDTLDNLKELIELYARTQQLKPEEKDKEKLEKKTEAFLKEFEGKPFDFAWTIYFAIAAEINPRQEHIRYASFLLSKFKRLPSYAETRFLLRLNDLKPEAPKDWPAEAIHSALQVVAEAEKVKATDPRALPWVRKLRDQADRKRSESERDLLSNNAASWAKAKAVLAEVLREYQALTQQLETIHKAQYSRDEAVVLLPTYPPLLESDPDGQRAWFEAVQTTQGLKELLIMPKDPAEGLTERLGKLGDLTESLRNSLIKLRVPMDPATLKRLMSESNRPNPTDWMEMNALLQVPWLAAKDRAALWAAWRGLSGRLQKEGQEAEGADAAQRTRLALPAFDASQAERQERERALLRARASLALLRLGGATELEKVEEAVSKAAQPQASPTALPLLGRDLLAAWRRLARQQDGQD